MQCSDSSFTHMARGVVQQRKQLRRKIDIAMNAPSISVAGRSAAAYAAGPPEDQAHRKIRSRSNV